MSYTSLSLSLVQRLEQILKRIGKKASFTNLLRNNALLPYNNNVKRGLAFYK